MPIEVFTKRELIELMKDLTDSAVIFVRESGSSKPLLIVSWEVWGNSLFIYVEPIERLRAKSKFTM